MSASEPFVHAYMRLFNLDDYKLMQLLSAVQGDTDPVLAGIAAMMRHSRAAAAAHAWQPANDEQFLEGLDDAEIWEGNGPSGHLLARRYLAEFPPGGAGELHPPTAHNEHL